MAGISMGSATAGGSSITGKLDVNYLVEQTIYAKQQPIRDFKPYQDLYKARKTSFNELNTHLSNLESSLYKLGNEGFKNKATEVSDPTIMSASASSIADNGDYSVKVKQLATAHAVTSSSVSDPDQTNLTSGTFTITQGSKTFSVDLSSTPLSLNGLKEQINADSDLNATAAVINYGTSAAPDYRLQIYSDKVGEANNFTVGGTTTDITTSVTNTGQNAQIYVNDFTNYISRDSNTINDVIKGVTLNLKSADVGKTVNLKVSTDSAGLKEKIQAFVDDYNKAIEFLNSQFKYNADTESAGVLSGDSVARKAQQDLLGFASGRVAGIPDEYAYKTFSTIGISMDNEGKLSIEDSVLDEKIENNFEDVKRLFTDSGLSDSEEVSFVAADKNTVPGSYEVVLTQVAEKAQVQGDLEMSAVDTTTDTVTVTYGGNSYDIAVSGTMDEIISALNTEFDDKGLKLSAGKSVSGSGHVLTITTDEYGSSETVKVNSSGTLFSSEKTDSGQDVEGTIGGNAATGSGNTLTGSEGDSKGLILQTTSTTTGSKGNITATKGPGEGLRELVYELTFPYSGIIAKSNEALDKQLNNIDEQIAQINRNLAKEEERLILEFTKANEAMARMDYLLNTLKEQSASK